MSKTTIPYSKTGFFSPLMVDYLADEKTIKPFYNRFPKIESFEAQIIEKSKSYTNNSRAVLVSELNANYKLVNVSAETRNNINLLSKEQTFTITTGHQLNLFTGPLYFLYKIVSVINLAKELKEKHPDKNFVPVYWMASEDHDFEEINYFNFKGKKVKWKKEAKGAVGDLNTKGLEDVYKLFSNELGLGDNANQLREWFNEAYLKHDNLSEATFYLANQLFKNQGLVIIDANKKSLKTLFIPQIKQELLKQTSFNVINKTSDELKAVNSNYKIQVNPREINFFYINNNTRERIVFENNAYKVLNTSLSFSEDELIKDVENNPQNYSPNVVLRPLYQEVILPNLCYIGGGGEMAYWFQLKDNFEAFNIPFPILLLRNSVLIQPEKSKQKIERLKIKTQDLFLKQEHLVKKVVLDLSKLEVDFTKQKHLLANQFKDLFILAEKTDASFIGAVAAQQKKQINGLEHLEKRLVKAQKRKFKDHTNRIVILQNSLFPNKNLQERETNFSEFYLEYGELLIPTLLENLKPLDQEFTVLTI